MSDLDDAVKPYNTEADLRRENERLRAEVERLSGGTLAVTQSGHELQDLRIEKQRAEQRADALAQRIAACPLANCGCRETDVA